MCCFFLSYRALHLNCIFALTVVLPSFALLFEGLRIPLPPATEAALALGSFLREKGLLLLAGAGTMAAGLFLWLRTARGRDAADRLFMKSAFVRRILLIRFCYSLSSLLSAGRPLSEALADTAKATVRCAGARKSSPPSSPEAAVLRTLSEKRDSARPFFSAWHPPGWKAGRCRNFSGKRPGSWKNGRRELSSGCGRCSARYFFWRRELSRVLSFSRS